MCANETQQQQQQQHQQQFHRDSNSSNSGNSGNSNSNNSSSNNKASEKAINEYNQLQVGEGKASKQATRKPANFNKYNCCWHSTENAPNSCCALQATEISESVSASTWYNTNSFLLSPARHGLFWPACVCVCV